MLNRIQQIADGNIYNSTIATEIVVNVCKIMHRFIFKCLYLYENAKGNTENYVILNWIK